ncbi:hypothetical protein CspeluHIS016_0211170 [Cutaneotrichosporon spelunceum]|uniref:Uracil permease n=1 Tax=Cutaneotrichosporon spelunceum TaxID=1672016 RepID=A0AAD3YAK1_9TREE|nr:hypothetical protein CspeluHIS016_0211170 [Cutaneotrichosporon spelunceum]
MADWVCDLFQPGGWATVAAFVASGLTWWESCLAVFVGASLAAIVISANGWVGSVLHTPFAVTSRATYGYWGSKFVVLSRCVIACFWLSINSYAGGQFISYAIQAIWSSYASLPNQLPASSGTSTRDMLSFFIFWVIQFPLIFIHPSKLKWIFNIKAVVVPIVALGTMIWALKKSGSKVGPALRNPVNRVPPGTARFVAFMYAVTSVQGVWATMSMNVGDFSRYLRKPKANLVQLVTFPAIFTVVSIVAAITATSLLPVYGDVLYQPYMIIAKWPTSPGGRAAMFLGGLAWALANATTNVTANSISAANDMVSLAPKYINIRRGQFIAATVGVWAFAPWKVLASAQNFLSFMAAYSVVLAPMAALMAADYFIVKRRKYNVYHLYRPNGIYHYTGGWNWRSYVALLCAIAPNLPGMVNAIDAKVHIGNIKYVYMVSNIVADFIAITVYYALSRVFPDHTSIIDQAVHDAKEVELEYSYDATGVRSEDKESFVFIQPE